MTSFRSCVAYLAVVAGVLAASPASAQSGRISASINFGAQASSGDFTQRLTPTIYDEPASIDIAQDYENGPLFDIGGGCHAVWQHRRRPQLLAHVRRRRGGRRRADSRIHCSSISPEAPRPSVDGLKHTEDAVHLQVFYRFAASPKLDVSVGVGPTFFSVKQELIDGVDVTEPTPTITPMVAEVSDSPVGVNFGADMTYMVTKTHWRRRAAPLRWPARPISRTPSGSSVSLDAGGFQFAGGLRVRF